MRYFFVSDIHGELDKLIEALNAAEFNENSDTLVVLGDSFDRGENSLGVLKFIMGCKNRLVVAGNHDLRLEDLLYDSWIDSRDYSNGVLQTMRSFCENDTLTSIDVGLTILKTDDRFKNTYRLLRQYLWESVYAIEWSNLIATHAWIPVSYTKQTKMDSTGTYITINNYFYDPEWRKASTEEWNNATWSHTGTLFAQRVFSPKKMIVGHWHSWRLRRMAESQDTNPSADFNFNTFDFEDKLVAIDGCSNAPQGKVNVWIFETDEEPTYYTGGQKW